MQYTCKFHADHATADYHGRSWQYVHGQDGVAVNCQPRPSTGSTDGADPVAMMMRGAVYLPMTLPSSSTSTSDEEMNLAVPLY